MLLLIDFELVLALLRTVKLRKRGLRHSEGEKGVVQAHSDIFVLTKLI